jgi:GAF domain-containing protein
MKATPDQKPKPALNEKTRIVYQNWREQFVAPLLIGSLVLGLFALIPALISAQSIYLDAAFIAVYLAVGLVTIVRFPYKVRMGVFLFLIYVLGLSELLSTGILGDGLFFFLAFIILSTMMLSPRYGMVATAVNLITFLFTGWLSLIGRLTFINSGALMANIADWLSAIITTLLFGVVIIAGFRRLELEFSMSQQQVDNTLGDLKNERTNLEKNVSERTRQLRRINEISRAISSILDPEELLPRVVNLIGNEFDCYYTAIFLLDNTAQWAELKEATGDAGRTLRDNKFRIDASGRNIIAMSIQARRPRIALDTGDDPVRFDNPLLRYTRSQVALPLVVGERVFGALDLQSTKGSAFGEQDLDTFQTMANQVAIALENARLFREAQQSLSEMRATQRQYLHSAWSTLASEQNLEYRLGDGEITDQTREVEIPLSLRDQIIGQINMSTNEEWTAEQRNLIESIAAQAALALENARLVEESQSSAAREKLTGEITSKIWSSSTTDAILQTAVRELGRALEASEVSIEISLGESDE